MGNIVTLTLNPTVDITWELDRLDPTGKNRARTCKVVGGGGGINVARGVAELGSEALAVHTAGGDVGRRLVRLLDDEGLPHCAVDIAGETREALILFLTGHTESYHVVPSGPEVDEDEGLACLDALLGATGEGTYVVVSGSLPDGLPSDLYREVTRRVKNAGGRIVLDTSGAALQAALEEGVFLVKPNKRELEDLIGRPVASFEDAREASERLLARGATQVAVATLGEHGALCSTPAGHHEIRNPPLEREVLSDAGAGDSLVAGIVTELARGSAAVQACVTGVAAAAASVTTPGTELFRRQEAEELRAKVEVRS